MQTLRKGSVGADVKILTGLLIKYGYLDIPPYESWLSIFGSRTDAAVRHFQTAQKIQVDGIVGPETWGRLMYSSSPLTKPASAHFTLAEFERNVHSPKYDDIFKPIPPEYYPDVQLLMNHLEVIRHKMGDKPIIVHSGYRCPAYNRAVGSSDGSQHVYAAAADVYIQGRVPNNYQLGKVAYDYIYRGGIGGVGLGNNSIVHIDIRAIKNCSRRSNATYWWYNFTSWAAWEKGQG